MSLEASAFVFTGAAPTLPAEFAGAAIPSMPKPTTATAKSGSAGAPTADAGTKAAASANPFANAGSISVKTFVPTAKPAESQQTQGQSNDGKEQRTDSISFDDFGGYSNPYSSTIDVEKEKRK